MNTKPGAPSPYRRKILQAAAAVASLPLLSACGSGDSSATPVLDDAAQFAGKRSLSFDDGWLFAAGAQSGDSASLPAFADQGWRQLDLPHDWSIEDLPDGSDDGAATAQPSHLFFFENPTLAETAPPRIGPFDRKASGGGRATGHFVGGEGWYRKHFTIAAAGVSADQHVELEFDGVYQNANVWINGHHLGFHPYGYTAFSHDLTPYLTPGDNVLAVRVRNLGDNSRWYSGSGIYRHTRLTFTHRVRIPRFGVALTTQQLGPAEAGILAAVTVHNSSAALAQPAVRVTVFNADGQQVAQAEIHAQTLAAGARQDALLPMKVADPQPWSPDTPHLYRAVVQVIVNGAVADQVTETFGIRTAAVSASEGFLLNGKALKLRGGNVHHDHGPLGAISLADQESWRLAILKQAGYNAIRIAHNPPSREFLQAADQLGLILINEFVDMWDVAKTPDDYHLYFAQWWERDMESWMLSSRNSPAVCIWSIANEIFDAAAADARGRQLFAKARSLDASRPIMQGAGQGIFGSFNTPTTASYADFGDIHYQLSFTAARQAVPGKAWMQSESFASSAYDHWKLVTDNAFVMGDFVWSAWDYMGETGMNVPQLIARDSDTDTSFQGQSRDLGKQASGLWGPYPWFAAGCGDFDLIGQVAPQHLYRRAVWDLSPIEMAVARPVSGGRQQQAFAFGWFDELESWSWDVPADTLLRVHVYTSADKVELFLNDTLLETQVLTDASKRIASFWAAFRPGVLRAVAYRSGNEIGRKELATAGKPAAIKLSADKMRLAVSGDALAHVLAQVVDQQGRLVPDAVVRIGFAVSGGELTAVGSGNPHNADSFRRARRYSYHGKAMAYIRPGKAAGRIVVSASADGLAPAQLELTAG